MTITVKKGCKIPKQTKPTREIKFWAKLYMTDEHYKVLSAYIIMTILAAIDEQLVFQPP